MIVAFFCGSSFSCIADHVLFLKFLSLCVLNLSNAVNLVVRVIIFYQWTILLLICFSRHLVWFICEYVHRPECVSNTSSYRDVFSVDNQVQEYFSDLNAWVFFLYSQPNYCITCLLCCLKMTWTWLIAKLIDHALIRWRLLIFFFLDDGDSWAEGVYD